MVLTKYEVFSDKVSRDYTFVMLSDLHNRDFTEAVRITRDQSPDMIFVVGDLVDRHKKTYDKALPFLRECVSVAETFFSYGNHEVKFPAITGEQILLTGARLLDNSYCLTGANGELAVGGQTPKSDTAWLDGFERENSDRFRILIDHHPEHYKKIFKDSHAKSLELILSGHAHGGQIRILGHSIFSPGQGLFPKYTKGFFDGVLIVGAGLANTGGIVPRWGNPTEVVRIDLKKK
ncbi:MAG: metallophosphoesterase [Clostridia bacterium]|nr:metallophosphoesterase [Clostridia bacterium]